MNNILHSLDPIFEPAQDSPSTLILVHPGSLFGSGNFNAGFERASRHRLAIAKQLLEHDGDLIVIDGFLSDEISGALGEALDFRLRNSIAYRSRHKGARPGKVHRVWGCDAGEEPYEDWISFGDPQETHIFRGQGEAARALSPHIKTETVHVTGAWATEHNRWGCVNHVVDVIQEERPDLSVCISPTALMDN